MEERQKDKAVAARAKQRLTEEERRGAASERPGAAQKAKVCSAQIVLHSPKVGLL